MTGGLSVSVHVSKGNSPLMARCESERESEAGHDDAHQQAPYEHIYSMMHVVYQ